MKYLAVLGRQPEISKAELAALFRRVFLVGEHLAIFSSEKKPDIRRLGGSLKIAEELQEAPLDYLKNLPAGKITLGVSSYGREQRVFEKTGNSKPAKLDEEEKRACQTRQKRGIDIAREALRLKKILARHGRSVRVVANNGGEALSTATALHNGLGGGKTNKVELIFADERWWRVVGIQDIEAYSRRDQGRPARDAKVGMLPPKLAQILINLCGELKTGARILDPFCGTGVVLQEALLMGYRAYGTDLSERMVKYAEQNLSYLEREFFKYRGSGAGANETLGSQEKLSKQNWPEHEVEMGDATEHTWKSPIDAVVFEGYLGQPMSAPPVEIKLKAEKQMCSGIILGFLKNLSSQIKSGTPVVMAVPAWLRPDGHYERLKIIDEAYKLGYNVENKTRGGLLYYREGQIVAREIIILRKK